MRAEEFALQAGTEVLHAIKVSFDPDGPRATIVCNAIEGAPCRMRPADDSVEEWASDYDGEMIDNGECWAVEWLEAAGWEGVIVHPTNEAILTLPVKTGYDGGLEVTILSPVTVERDEADAKTIGVVGATYDDAASTAQHLPAGTHVTLFSLRAPDAWHGALATVVIMTQMAAPIFKTTIGGGS